MFHALTTKKRKLHSWIQDKDADSGCTLLSTQVKNSNVVKECDLIHAMDGIEEMPRYSSEKSAMLQLYNSTKC